MSTNNQYSSAPSNRNRIWAAAATVTIMLGVLWGSISSIHGGF